MAQLHSLIALQQFMRGLGEEMDEAELVWNIEKKKKKRKKENLSHGKYKNLVCRVSRRYCWLAEVSTS